MQQLSWLEKQGFEVVEHHLADRASIEEEVAWFSEQIVHNDFPSDGLVLVYDDIAYGQSLGTTAKFRGIPMPLNGRMRSERRHFWRLSGVRQGQA